MRSDTLFALCTLAFSGVGIVLLNKINKRWVADRDKEFDAPMN
jgi:hypothetical protein